LRALPPNGGPFQGYGVRLGILCVARSVLHPYFSSVVLGMRDMPSPLAIPVVMSMIFFAAFAGWSS